MEVAVEKTGPNRCKLSVVVEAAKVSAAFEKVYRDLARHAVVPGYRKGKAPKQVLQLHYGKRVRAEVEQSLLEEHLQQALKDNEVAPVAPPELEEMSLELGGEFKFTAAVDTFPEVEVTTFKGLEIPKQEAEDIDGRVETELETMRQEHAQWVPVQDRAVVQMGDRVTLDYKGTVDGVAFEGGTAEDALIEVGSKDYLPAFSEGLEGTRVPGETSFDLTFPEDYGVADLAGKVATFEATVKELKTKEIPALDDDFAQDLGDDDLAALTARVREQIEAEAERKAKDGRTDAVLEALVAANPFELPESMVKQQAERNVDMAMERMKMMMGGKTWPMGEAERAELVKSGMKHAEQQVRGALLLAELAKRENIEVEDEAIDAEIDKRAKAAGQHEAQARAFYSDPRRRDEMRHQLQDEKTLDLLLGNAVESAVKSKSDDNAADGDDQSA